MTIDEAIRIKGLTGDEFLHTDPDDIEEADRLSVEALKQFEFHRRWKISYFMQLLPGETEKPSHHGLPLKGIVVLTEKGETK